METFDLPTGENIQRDLEHPDFFADPAHDFVTWNWGLDPLDPFRLLSSEPLDGDTQSIDAASSAKDAFMVRLVANDQQHLENPRTECNNADTLELAKQSPSRNRKRHSHIQAMNWKTPNVQVFPEPSRSRSGRRRRRRTHGRSLIYSLPSPRNASIKIHQKHKPPKLRNDATIFRQKLRHVHWAPLQMERGSSSIKLEDRHSPIVHDDFKVSGADALKMARRSETKRKAHVSSTGSPLKKRKFSSVETLKPGRSGNSKRYSRGPRKSNQVTSKLRHHPSRSETKESQNATWEKSQTSELDDGYKANNDGEEAELSGFESDSDNELQGRHGKSECLPLFNSLSKAGDISLLAESYLDLLEACIGGLSQEEKEVLLAERARLKQWRDVNLQHVLGYCTEEEPIDVTEYIGIVKPKESEVHKEWSPLAIETIQKRRVSEPIEPVHKLKGFKVPILDTVLEWFDTPIVETLQEPENVEVLLDYLQTEGGTVDMCGSLEEPVTWSHTYGEMVHGGDGFGKSVAGPYKHVHMVSGPTESSSCFRGLTVDNGVHREQENETPGENSVEESSVTVERAIETTAHFTNGGRGGSDSGSDSQKRGNIGAPGSNHYAEAMDENEVSDDSTLPNTRRAKDGATGDGVSPSDKRVDTSLDGCSLDFGDWFNNNGQLEHDTDRDAKGLSRSQIERGRRLSLRSSTLCPCGHDCGASSGASGRYTSASASLHGDPVDSIGSLGGSEYEKADDGACECSKCTKAELLEPLKGGEVKTKQSIRRRLTTIRSFSPARSRDERQRQGIKGIMRRRSRRHEENFKRVKNMGRRMDRKDVIITKINIRKDDPTDLRRDSGVPLPGNLADWGVKVPDETPGKKKVPLGGGPDEERRVETILAGDNRSSSTRLEDPGKVSAANKRAMGIRQQVDGGADGRKCEASLKARTIAIDNAKEVGIRGLPGEADLPVHLATTEGLLQGIPHGDEGRRQEQALAVGEVMEIARIEQAAKRRRHDERERMLENRCHESPSSLSDLRNGNGFLIFSSSGRRSPAAADRAPFGRLEDTLHPQLRPTLTTRLRRRFTDAFQDRSLDIPVSLVESSRNRSPTVAPAENLTCRSATPGEPNISFNRLSYLGDSNGSLLESRSSHTSFATSVRASGDLPSQATATQRAFTGHTARSDSNETITQDIFDRSVQASTRRNSDSQSLGGMSRLGRYLLRRASTPAPRPKPSPSDRPRRGTNML